MNSCVVCSLKDTDLSLGQLLYQFDVHFKKTVGKTPVFPEDSTNLNEFFIGLVNWCVQSLGYLITHWCVYEFLVQDHIMHECLHIARIMEQNGGAILRKHVCHLLNKQYPSVPRMIDKCLKAIRKGMTIDDRSAEPLSFMCDFSRRTKLEYKCEITMMKNQITKHLLITDLVSLISEYAPVCTCKCRFANILKTGYYGDVVVGCDILECGQHLACTCCKIVSFITTDIKTGPIETDAALCSLSECTSTSSCLLCRADCRDCERSVCTTPCLQPCTICASPICRECGTECVFCGDMAQCVMCLTCTKSHKCNKCTRVGCVVQECEKCTQKTCDDCGTSCTRCYDTTDELNMVCMDCIPSSNCSSCDTITCPKHLQTCIECKQLVCVGTNGCGTECTECENIMCRKCTYTRTCGFCETIPCIACEPSLIITMCRCGSEFCKTCLMECCAECCQECHVECYYSTNNKKQKVL